MEGMVDPPDQPVPPDAALDLLGLVDIAQSVGEARLAVAEDPPEQGRGRGHEQADAGGMWPGGHAGPSFRGFRRVAPAGRAPGRILAHPLVEAGPPTGRLVLVPSAGSPRCSAAGPATRSARTTTSRPRTGT